MVQITEAAKFHDDAVAMNQALLLGSVRQHELTDAAELLNVQLQAAIIVSKKAEEALIGSEKLASAARMASVLAHEINKPSRGGDEPVVSGANFCRNPRAG